MDIVAKLDEWGKPAWITAMILGFVLFWPIGLAILAYMIWSRRMGCAHHEWHGRNREDWRAMREEWRDRKREFKQEMREMWRKNQMSRREGAYARSSGNSAFDDYKAETIRRLEEEQEEFRDFLDHLRKSKDKAEFDDFMKARRDRPATSETVITPPPSSENGDYGNTNY